MSRVSPTYLSVGSLFIDDIVYADGTTRMEILGGGATHAAMGMRVWGETPGFMAFYGNNLPAPLWARISAAFDTDGMVKIDLPQARAWQLFEWDGKRTEIPRVKHITPFMVLPDPAHVPAHYHSAQALYLLCDADMLPAWRALFPQALILWEPQQAYMVSANAAEFRAALPLAQIVSPNLLEASQIYDNEDPEALVRAMLADGAQVVALRMGERGSLVGNAVGMFAVPPVPVPAIIDQTGAGNTYCGGFLVGYLRTADAYTAGCYGAVSASFSLEQVGVLDFSPEQAPLRDARLHALTR